MPPSTEQFISEPIEPAGLTMDASRMAMGEPGLPRRFRWRKTEYEVADVIERWKDSAPCRNGSGEMYLRKHWYAVRTTCGLRMTVYFERQRRRGAAGRIGGARWWLYTIANEVNDATS